MEEYKSMAFGDHLSELKKRLLLFIAIFVITELVAITVATNILEFLAKAFSLVSIEPLDVFNSAILISFVLSLLVIYPIGLFFLIDFLAPAFNTIKPVVKIFIASTILFYAGFLFGAIVFGGIMLFLAKQFAQSINVQVLWTTMSFIKFVFMNGLIFAFLFQLPLVVFLGLKLRIVDEKKVVKNSWVAFPAIIIFSEWVTPPDPFSFLIMAIPLTLLFYGSLFGTIKLNNWGVI